MTEKQDKPRTRRVKIVGSTYRPSKAELAGDLRVNATFDEAVAALARPVKIRRVVDSKERR